MKFLDRQAAIGAAIFLLSVPSQASHSHLGALDKRHGHFHHLKKAQSSPRAEGLGEAVQEVKKRGVCPFPTDAGLQAVTPGSSNAGWAMAPDMPCVPGMYCPYACPPGQLMAQWDPASVTSYQADTRTHGGLYCDQNGAISKPFPDKPYCVPGVGNVKVQNNCGDVHAVCQTMLPGYEDMLDGTEVPSGSSKTLAVPDTNYWLGTAAHYYHNKPGVSIEDGCKWGDNQHNIGNWAPYVSGANKAADGNTYVKLAWNPIYLEPTSKYVNVLPDWGMSISCEHDGCNGLPCAIDPSVNSINAMVGGQASGAGGGNFCVVTVPQGNTAIITVFKAGGLGGDGKPKADAVAAASSQSSSTTSKTTSTTTSSTSSTRTSSTTSTSTTHTTSSSSTISSVSSSMSYAPHVLFQNDTSTTSMSSTVMVSQSGTSTAMANATTVITSAATTASATGNAASGTVVSSGHFGLGALMAVALACLL